MNPLEFRSNQIALVGPYEDKQSHRSKYAESYNDELIDDDIPHLIPEQNLLVAVLERAVRDALGYERTVCPRPSNCQITTERMIFKSRYWINSDENYPWSYVWMCEHLNLNPQALREVIMSTNIALSCAVCDTPPILHTKSLPNGSKVYFYKCPRCNNRSVWDSSDKEMALKRWAGRRLDDLGNTEPPHNLNGDKAS